MTVTASNGHTSAAAARDAAVSDVKDGMDQLNAAVQSFCSGNNDVGDVADKAQRQKIIEAAQNVLNAVKRPDDVWVDSELYHPQSESPQRLLRTRKLTIPKSTWTLPASLLANSSTNGEPSRPSPSMAAFRIRTWRLPRKQRRHF